MTVVIGTAGHIDHGKTSLLRALTGIDADRLPEERRRGMTIDVGYAHLDLPDGSTIDFVDVPGHDRLVGNMLVGAGEIDAALLVVAADDGPRAQTFEHLELLDALGIGHGVVAVTKADVAGETRTAAVILAVRALVERTSLAGSPVLAVASPSGEGIAELRSALLELRDRVLEEGGSGTPGGPRLAIDRVFSVKGRGVVVTGSLRGGSLSRGDELRLLPSDRTAIRVREIQVHGTPREAVTGGGRVALNLAGLEVADVGRGDILANDPAVRAGDHLLVLLRPPSPLVERAPTNRWPLAPGATYRLHIGTESIDATIRRGARAGVTLPDGRRVATLRIARSIAVAVGDRFVLRVPSPAATAAGGTVLDVAPPVGASRRRASGEGLAALAAARESGEAPAVLAALTRLHGWVPRSAVPTIDGQRVPAGVRAFDRGFLDESIGDAVADEAMTEVDAHHDREPLVAGLPRAELGRTLARGLRRRVTVDERNADGIVAAILDDLVASGRLARMGDLVRDPRRSSGELPPPVLAAMDRLEASLAVPAPPPLSESARRAGCPAEGVRALEAAGRIVRVETDLAWAGSTYRDLEALALGLATPGPLTPATLRDATGTSRKYVMALLEDLDRRGVLRRTADGHVPGPRAPR